MGNAWSSEPRQNSDLLPLPKNTPSQSTHYHNQPSPYNYQPFTSASINPTTSHPPLPASLNQKHSHLDPPNFPLQANPVSEASNLSLRPLTVPPFHAHQVTPASRNQNPSDRPPSYSPSDSSISADSFDRDDSPWQDDSDDFNDFVDLTTDSSPPSMPPTKKTPATKPRKLAISGPSTRAPGSPSNPAKRRKTEASQSSNRSSQRVEEVDLRDVDDDKGLQKVLEQQRMATIKAQQEQANKPSKLSTLQCIICMEPMKDITATHCGGSQLITSPISCDSKLIQSCLGHLFCHTCLMEALIAGENQGAEPGKGTPKCPVCRKKVLRPKDHKPSSQVVPLAIKFKTKSSVGKGKARAVNRD